MKALSRIIGILALACITVNAVPLYGQCGGSGYSGSTQCDAGLTCVVLNTWYSQCQAGGGGNPPVVTPPPPVSTSPPPVTTPPPIATVTTVAPPAATTPPASEIPAGQLTRLSANFGPNPGNVAIFVYKPSSVKPAPGLLIALHPCGGNAQQYFSGSGFRGLADQRGFMILYGQTTKFSNCWDVTGRDSLVHDAGGDSLGIASAIRYAISQWGVDKNKVFVTGTSSGAMMTNVMAGTYPDLIKAGAVFAGVPFNCLVSGNAPANPPDQCAEGRRTLSATEWGRIFRAGYPGYTGAYPRMQIWHGTSDPILKYAVFQEQVKQWTDVHGVSATPSETRAGYPKSSWTRTSYGSEGKLQAFSGQGAGHGLPESGTEVVAIDFFGL